MRQDDQNEKAAPAFTCSNLFSIAGTIVLFTCSFSANKETLSASQHFSLLSSGFIEAQHLDCQSERAGRAAGETQNCRGESLIRSENTFWSQLM